jgi:tetratricopeptide (TPR) repeat protein
MSIFKKKDIFKVKSVPVDPASMGEPATAEDYVRRGMAYYARKQFDAAAADLNKAISLNPKEREAYYALGMVMKAQGKKEEAVAAFQQALDLIASETGPNQVKTDMLRRLALGHINEISQGDWNLEKEIWQHIP